MNRWLYSLLFILIGISFLSAQSEVVYFYEEGCLQCERLSPILDELAAEYSLSIAKYDVGTAEGYNLFKEYGLTKTPALLIHGKILEGNIERTAIVEALHESNSLLYLVIAFILGMVSALSPTLMSVHSDIISDVARTTRKEMDVVMRSLLFYAGIWVIAACLFLILSNKAMYYIIGPFFGFVLSLSLLNSALHSFNSYTRIDLYIKAKIITIESTSALKLGLLHGIGKFPDSLPLFFPLLYIVSGAFSSNLGALMLFFLGMAACYAVILLLAIVQINLFRKLAEGISQLYFFGAGLLVMTTSIFLFLEAADEFNFLIGLILVVLVTIVSGILVGFKRRIVY